jgi:hypothetical protein
VRQFDSLVLSEVPGVVLCFFACVLRENGKGAFSRKAPQRYKLTSPPLRDTVVPLPSAKSSGSQKIRT